MRTTRIVAVLLILFAVYNVWITMTYAMPVFLLLVAVCMVAAIGVWFERPWSRWLVYVIAALSMAMVVTNIMLLAMSGWPLSWPSESLTALVPAALAMAVFGWMIVATRRHFRQPA